MANQPQAQPEQSAQHSGVRRWRRYPVSLSLRMRVPTEAGQEYMLAHGRDVSQGGMAVYVPIDLELGQTVLLEVAFRGHPEPLTLSATVKNRTGFQYGVEFQDPTPQQQEIILVNLPRLLASTSLD